MFRTVSLSLAALLFGGLLSGCESLSPAECATANWQQLGVQDGSRGVADRAASYHESCSKAGVQVDLARYRAGRVQGLQSYCQLDNAVREGMAGRSYDGVCTGPGEPTFRRFHQAGRDEYQAREEISRLRREQDNLDRELRDPKTSADRQRQVRDQLRQSDRRMQSARDGLRDAQYRIDRLSVY